MEAEVKNKEHEIACQIRKRGRDLENNYKHDENLLVWVIWKDLSCAHRPLRYHPLYGGSGKNLSVDATPYVIDWAETIFLLGIKSIICLMHQKDIDYYKALDLDAPNLIEFYKKFFEVQHIPWEDPQHSKTNKNLIGKKLKQVRQDALRAYNVLQKPVLIHCSAGVDRSAPVAAYIWWYKGRPMAA
jgi:protein-tyrosine phosphatase